MTRRRITKAALQALYDAAGQNVTLERTELRADVDGLPLDVGPTERAGGVLVALPLKHYGWTPEEWADPNITE